MHGLGPFQKFHLTSVPITSISAWPAADRQCAAILLQLGMMYIKLGSVPRAQLLPSPGPLHPRRDGMFTHQRLADVVEVVKSMGMVLAVGSPDEDSARDD